MSEIKLNSIEDFKFNISKNILIDSAGIKRNKSLCQNIKEKNYKLLKKVYNLSFIKNKFPDLYNKHINKNGSADYKNASPIMRETLVKAISEDLRPYLKNIKIPTLLIWGDLDTATPIQDAYIMEKEIKDAGLVVLKNTGHFSFLEDSRTFTLAIKSFLEIG